MWWVFASLYFGLFTAFLTSLCLLVTAAHWTMTVLVSSSKTDMEAWQFGLSQESLSLSRWEPTKVEYSSIPSSVQVTLNCWWCSLGAWITSWGSSWSPGRSWQMDWMTSCLSADYIGNTLRSDGHSSSSYSVKYYVHIAVKLPIPNKMMICLVLYWSFD